MTTTLADPPLTPAEVLAILADARTWPRCPECGGINPEKTVNTSELHDAVDAINHALQRGANRLDLFGGYSTEGGTPTVTLLVSEDQPCDDVMGSMGGDLTIAFAQAPTLTDALIVLAGSLAEAGYRAVSVP